MPSTQLVCDSISGMSCKSTRLQVRLSWYMSATVCRDKDQDAWLKSAELAGVKEPSGYNYTVRSRDCIIKSCDIKLTMGPEGPQMKINVIMATGQDHVSMEVRDSRDSQKCNLSVWWQSPQRRPASSALTHRPLNTNYNPIISQWHHQGEPPRQGIDACQSP